MLLRSVPLHVTGSGPRHHRSVSPALSPRVDGVHPRPCLAVLTQHHVAGTQLIVVGVRFPVYL